MKCLEIKYMDEHDGEGNRRVLECIDGAESLEALILCWTSAADRSVETFSGMDSDDPSIQLVGVVLSEKDKQIAEVYILNVDIAAQAPDVRSLNSFILGVSREGELKVDDAALEAWERALGFSYSSALSDDLGPQRALLPFILPYVLADGGSVSIQRVKGAWDPEFLEECAEQFEAEELNVSDLMQVCVQYFHPAEQGSSQPGWVSHRYVRAELSGS
jgi:hypothetical protein